MSGAVVLAVAGLFLAMGAYGLVAPASLIRPFGICLPSPEARTEVRAVYGGFGVAMALVLAAASVNSAGVRTGAVTAVAAALLGMSGARLLARAIDAPRGFYPTWFYLLVETTGACVLLLAVWA